MVLYPLQYCSHVVDGSAKVQSGLKTLKRLYLRLVHHISVYVSLKNDSTHFFSQMTFPQVYICCVCH